MARKKQYINNKDLLEEFIKYKERLNQAIADGVEKPRVPNYIGEALLLIGNNLARRPNFSGYTYKQEMISDAIVMCLAAVDNFDHNKSVNPFGYFTQIAWNAFILRIQKEKKQQYIKSKNFENVYLMSDENNGQLASNEFIDAIVKDFEDKLLSKKQKENSITDSNIEEEDYDDEE